MSVCPANGPTCRAVSKIAIADATSVVVAASRWLNRRAAQIEKGKMAKPSGELIAPVANQPPNTIWLTTASSASSAPASPTLRRLQVT